MIYYECGICGWYHPWDFKGDCRDNANRFSDEEIPFDAEIRSMDERVDADLRGE